MQSIKNPFSSLRISRPRLEWILAALLFLLGGALRLFDLGSKSLWFDEILTVQMSSGSFDQILQGLKQYTNSPPLFHWILHLFLKLGVNEFWSRLPSAIFGILTLVLVYLMGKSLFGKRYAFFALLLFAISPLFIYYSQEARMYSLWTFLVTLSYYYLYQLLSGKGTAYTWGGYFFSLLLCIYTHYFTVFHLFTQALIVGGFFLASRAKKITGWLPFLAVWGLLVPFAIPVILLSRYGFPHGVGLPLSQWTLSLVFEQFLRSLVVFLSLSGGGSYYLNYNFPISIVLFALFYLGLYLSLRRNPRFSLIGLAWIILPLYSGMVFLVERTDFHERFFLPVTVPYLLFAALGLQGATGWAVKRLRKALRRIKFTSVQVVRATTMLVPALLGIAVFLSPLQYYYKMEKQDNRGVAAYISSNALPGDSIILDGFGALTLPYYLKDFVVSVKEPESQAAIAALGGDCRRVWYIYGWEGSGIWKKPELQAWSQTIGAQAKVFQGSFPMYVSLIGPEKASFQAEVENARDSYTRALESASTGILYGNCLYTTGEWEAAARVYGQAADKLEAELSKGDASPAVKIDLTLALLGFGDAQVRLGNVKDAAQAYQKARALDASRVTARGDLDSILGH